MTMSNQELNQEVGQETKKEIKEIAVTYEIDNVVITLTPKIVQEFIIGNNSKITLPEFKFFTELCRVRKLNPFLKEAYCIKYGDNPAQIVISKDVVINRAANNPYFDGIESGIIVLNEKGEVIDRKGMFKLPNEKLVGGWARVYRKDWKYPTYCSVSFDEVAQRKSNGELNSNWATKGATMVEKVAKVRALRETFTQDFLGLELDDEVRTVNGIELKEEIVEPQNEPNVDIDGVVSLNDL